MNGRIIRNMWSFQWCFTRVKQGMVYIKDLVKRLDIVVINICVIVIVTLYLLLYDNK